MSTDPRLQAILDFVPRHLTETATAWADGDRHDPAYRWQHSLRVSRYGKVIAEAEEADVELVVAACLLHDVARYSPGPTVDHGRRGAELVRPLLPTWGYTADETEAICYAIAAHVDDPAPATLLAKIVSDADNIDRFGVYRVAFQLLHGGESYSERIEAARVRLETLRKYRQEVMMQTTTGQVIFNEKLDFQIDFLTELLREHALSIVPEL